MMKFLAAIAILTMTAAVHGAPAWTLTDPVAYDAETGLYWRRCPSGSSLESNGLCNAPYYYDRKKSLELENDGWRLPSADELSKVLKFNYQIYDSGKRAFPQTRGSGWFRTTTSSIVSYSGKIDSGYDFNEYEVILVKGKK